jgi:hypothetical protein
MPSTAGRPDRPSFDYVASSESVVPSTPGARSVYMVVLFPSDIGLRHRRMARRAPSPPASDFPRDRNFDVAGILFDYDPLVHSPSWSLPRSYARRGLCHSSFLGIRFRLPSRASYPDESTNFRDRIRTCLSHSFASCTRRPSVYTPYAPASLGTLRVSAFRKGPGDSLPVARRSAATSPRPRPAQLPSSN